MSALDSVGSFWPFERLLLFDVRCNRIPVVDSFAAVKRLGDLIGEAGRFSNAPDSIGFSGSVRDLFENPPSNKSKR
jgi:hypothetical protein